jgi:hypothetical protein
MSCKSFQEITVYRTKTVNPIGIVLNLMCVVCFAQILWKKNESASNMFKYLLVKAVCNFLYFSDDIFYLFYNKLWPTLSYEIWLVYIYNSIQPIVLLISAIMEVMATLGKSF